MTHAPAAKKRAAEDEDGDSEADSSPPPPDGGWGWVVVWASFMIHVVTDGVAYSFGVLLRRLVVYFNGGEGATSLIVSMLYGVTLCSGPIASAFVNKWGCRAVTIAGAVMSGFFLFVSFFAQNIPTLYVTVGLGTGLGFGLIYLPAIVSVTCYFDKYRSLATGIAVCGSGLGTFIFAPFIEYLLNEYGWRGTVLIIAGLVLNTAIMGALFRPIEETPRKRRKSVELKVLNGDKAELKQLLNGDQIAAPPQTLLTAELPPAVSDAPEAAQARSAHNIPNAVNGDVMQPRSLGHHTVPRNAKVLSLNLSATPQSILGVSQHHHHHHQSARHRSDVARLALSQPSLQTTTGSVQHLAGSGVMYRKDIFYRGSLVNIPHHRSASRLSRHHSAGKIDESLAPAYVGAAGGVLVDKIDDEERLTVCGCIPCSPETKDTLSEMLDVSLFKDVIFILFTVSNFLTSIGFYVPYTFLPAYAEAIGVSSLEASYLVSVIGAANTIGRIILGYLADKPWVNRLLVYNLSLTFAGISCCLVVFCNDFWSLSVCASIYGFTIGAYVGLTSVILVDLLGLDKLTNAFGLLLLFQGIASFAGAPIGGWIYDITLSYAPGFWVAGIAMAGSGVMLFVVPPLQRRIAAEKRLANMKVSAPIISNGNVHPQDV